MKALEKMSDLNNKPLKYGKVQTICINLFMLITIADAHPSTREFFLFHESHRFCLGSPVNRKFVEIYSGRKVFRFIRIKISSFM